MPAVFDNCWTHTSTQTRLSFQILTFDEKFWQNKLKERAPKLWESDCNRSTYSPTDTWPKKQQSGAAATTTMENESNELSNSQMQLVLQFQDFLGIDDMNVCRDVLTRHQWNLEVAIQEQLNIREGRPSVYATESRPVTVINDRYLQHVFTSADNNASPSSSNSSSNQGFFRFVYDYVVNFFYSNIMFLVNLFKSQERIVTDPLGDVVNFIRTFDDRYPVHPVFYQGTYAQALNDAKRELKFLLVFLHSERQNASEVASLCRNALSNGEVVEYINRNMLLWGCDVSSPEGICGFWIYINTKWSYNNWLFTNFL